MFNPAFSTLFVNAIKYTMMADEEKTTDSKSI
jgi:hypothetical protein